MPSDHWKVFSFKLDELASTDDILSSRERVSYEISLSHPQIPPSAKDEVLWFQHAFGMWGRESPAFTEMVNQAKRKKKKVIASFHTIHFESEETESGMAKREEELLEKVLPRLDLATVFSDGSYQAISRAFPEYRKKVVVLRHGVHLYPQIEKVKAREKLLKYLIEKAEIPPRKKQELKDLYPKFFSDDTILMGNFGFITPDKDPLQLYRIGELVQEEVHSREVVVLYIGRIQKRKDRKMEKSLPILKDLQALHDGKKKLFIEDYLSEEVFPYAFGALDYSIFWCHNATQSGRMAHAMGTPTCVVGRRIEGVGETLDLAGLPAGVSLKDMAEKIAKLILEPELRAETRRLSWEYAQRFSFANQAKKHLLVEEAVKLGKELPRLDRSKPDYTFILPNIAIGSRKGLEDSPEDIAAFLNVADDVEDIFPQPKNYYKIPLKDGVPPPVEKLEAAIKWIRKYSKLGKVLIFCRYGKGRSVSVVIGYLCSLGLSYDEALRLVGKRRPAMNPLPGLAEKISLVLKKEKYRQGEHESRVAFSHPLANTSKKIRQLGISG